jgi:hypothetical protein
MRYFRIDGAARKCLFVICEMGEAPNWPALPRSRAAAPRQPPTAGNMCGSILAVLINLAAQSFRKQSTPCFDGTKMLKYATPT